MQGIKKEIFHTSKKGISMKHFSQKNRDFSLFIIVGYFMSLTNRISHDLMGTLIASSIIAKSGHF